MCTIYDAPPIRDFNDILCGMHILNWIIIIIIVIVIIICDY